MVVRILSSLLICVPASGGFVSGVGVRPWKWKRRCPCCYSLLGAIFFGLRRVVVVFCEPGLNSRGNGAS